MTALINTSTLIDGSGERIAGARRASTVKQALDAWAQMGAGDLLYFDLSSYGEADRVMVKSASSTADAPIKNWRLPFASLEFGTVAANQCEKLAGNDGMTGLSGSPLTITSNATYTTTELQLPVTVRRPREIRLWISDHTEGGTGAVKALRIVVEDNATGNNQMYGAIWNTAPNTWHVINGRVGVSGPATASITGTAPTGELRWKYAQSSATTYHGTSEHISGANVAVADDLETLDVGYTPLSNSEPNNVQVWTSRTGGDSVWELSHFEIIDDDYIV